MSGLRTEALLLRALDFGESDRIVHLLTPERGRVAAIAKGARRSVRRFPGTLDIGNRLAVQLVLRRPGALARDRRARPARCAEPVRESVIAYGASSWYVLTRVDLPLAARPSAPASTRPSC